MEVDEDKVQDERFGLVEPTFLEFLIYNYVCFYISTTTRIKMYGLQLRKVNPPSMEVKLVCGTESGVHRNSYIYQTRLDKIRSIYLTENKSARKTFETSTEKHYYHQPN